MNILLFVVYVILGSVVYASLLEYLLHRYIMHKPLKIFGYQFRYPFEAHTVTHHHIFKADHTYHLINDKDKHTIPMAWWNGPVLIAISALPPFILSLLTYDWLMLIIPTVVVSCYYGTYEYIHWCMHLPKRKRRLVERKWFTGYFFYRLNGHHLLHHRYMGKNFNVVCPIWDLLTGTLVLHAKTHFKQAIGPCVPDVQPKS